MKTIQLLPFVAGLFLSILNSRGQTTWDFEYGYQNVFQPNATEYIVQENNMTSTSEGGNGVSYYNPINNGEAATLTQEFTFPDSTTEVFLNATIATYNFGNGLLGDGSLWASTNGINWQLLENAPAPSYMGYPYGYSSTYDGDLPTSLLGSDQLWIQVQLETSGSDILAQFSRTGVPNNPAGDMFDLDANYGSVPDTNLTAFLLIFAISILTFVCEYFPTTTGV